MSQFEFLGPAYISAMGLTLALPVLLWIIVRRYERTTRGICIAFAGLLLVNETAHWIWRLATAGVEALLQLSLPLHVCGIAVFAVMVALVFRNRIAYEIAWFRGIAGTTNAPVTPRLEVGFRMTASFNTSSPTAASSRVPCSPPGVSACIPPPCPSFAPSCSTCSASWHSGQPGAGQQLHVPDGTTRHAVAVLVRAVALVSCPARRVRAVPVRPLAAPVHDPQSATRERRRAGCMRRYARACV